MELSTSSQHSRNFPIYSFHPDRPAKIFPPSPGQSLLKYDPTAHEEIPSATRQSSQPISRQMPFGRKDSHYALVLFLAIESRCKSTYIQQAAILQANRPALARKLFMFPTTQRPCSVGGEIEREDWHSAHWRPSAATTSSPSQTRNNPQNRGR